MEILRILLTIVPSSKRLLKSGTLYGLSLLLDVLETHLMQEDFRTNIDFKNFRQKQWPSATGLNTLTEDIAALVQAHKIPPLPGTSLLDTNA